MTAAGDRYMMMFNLDQNARFGNILYDMQTRKSISVTRNADPYPTPDGQYYMQLHPLKIYRTQDAIRDGLKTQPIFTDDQMLNGAYESLGVRVVNGKKIMRVETESDDGRDVREYEIDESGAKPTFKRTSSKAVKACSNLHLQYLMTPLRHIS